MIDLPSLSVLDEDTGAALDSEWTIAPDERDSSASIVYVCECIFCLSDVEGKLLRGMRILCLHT